ncbi:MAG TPA: DUF6300 family protein [Microlunatus sp.]
MRATITRRDIPNCQRCNEPGILHISYPTGSSGAEDQPCHGHLEHVLCSQCDTDLAAICVVEAVCDTSLTDEDYERHLIDVVMAWIQVLRSSRPDPTQLDQDVDKYFRGVL